MSENTDNNTKPPPAPAPGSAWQPMSTAPMNATTVRVLMDDGTIHEKAHWACDLSGEEQPPFRGWFIPRNPRHYGFVGIDEPVGWMPAAPNMKKTNSDAEPPSIAATSSDHPMRCLLCGEMSEITECEMIIPTMPNTLTGLPDHNNPQWKCLHCAGWN